MNNRHPGKCHVCGKPVAAEAGVVDMWSLYIVIRKTFSQVEIYREVNTTRKELLWQHFYDYGEKSPTKKELIKIANEFAKKELRPSEVLFTRSILT